MKLPSLTVKTIWQIGINEIFLYGTEIFSRVHSDTQDDDVYTQCIGRLTAEGMIFLDDLGVRTFNPDTVVTVWKT